MPPTAGPLAASAAPTEAATGAAAGEARVAVPRGGVQLRVLSEGSVALLGASVLLMVVLCAWLLVAEVRLRRRRSRWRPRPPPRPGARPSRVLLLAAEGSDADDGYVQPRSIPAVTLPARGPAPALGPPRAHSYLLVLAGDPAGANAAAYEQVDGAYLRPKAPGAEEGYVPMQRRRVPTVLRVVRGGAQGEVHGGELVLALGAADVAREEYLFMEPQTPPSSHGKESRAQAPEVVLTARPLPPLPPPPAPAPEYSTCGPPS